ncbi:MAG: AEC family transporter [Lachnospiraceae bacterium]|nr:AEC family transporter [Lachnospiraceae bacterium]MCD8249967.1 AEC family transporter [Lachnospiraceae bacterium]
MNSEVMNQVWILFGLILVGYLVGKLKIVDGDAGNVFSRFLVNIALPAMSIYSAATQQDITVQTLFSALGAVIGIYILLPVISLLVAKVFHMVPTCQLLLNYSNLGLMGLPIIRNIYGNEGVLYVLLFMLVYNLHLFTVGTITLSGSVSDKRAMLKKLLTPASVSSVLAFMIVLLKIQLPTLVIGITESLSDVQIPLGMAVIGLKMTDVRILDCLKNRTLYIISFLKLAIYPAITYAFMYLLFGPCMLTNTATVLMGLPVGSMVTVACLEYDGDASLAAQGTCATTLFSLVTIPLMIMILF